MTIVLALMATAGVLQAQQPPPAASPSPSPSPGASPAATFPAQIEQVIVDAVVTDRKGVSITGLGRGDFTVVEDDQPQAIASFEEVAVPAMVSASPPPPPRVSINTRHEVRTGRSFVVVFDDIHLSPFQAQRAKGAVAEFLKKGVREGDRVTLVATGGGAWWTARMESGRDQLLELLKRLDGRLIPDMSQDRVTDYEAMRIHVYHDTQVAERVRRRFETYGVNPGSQAGERSMGMAGEVDPMVSARASDVYFQAVSRNRITLQVIERALQALAPNKGRKSMVLVSEGFIYDPNLDEFKKVLQASRRSNVAVYFLDTRGLSGMPAYMTAQFGPAIDSQDIGAAFTENLEAAEGAESIASDTGGFTVKNTNALGEGIQRIANESRSYYLIGYNPTNNRRDGRFRKIEVKVARKGAKVRARKGYYAPLEGLVAEKKPGVDPEFQAALDSPYDVDAIPMRMTAYVFDETLLGKATVRVATDVDLRNFAFQETEGRFADTLEFLMVVAHRETGEFFRYDQKIDMKLLAGTRERLLKDWMPIVRDFELSPGGYQAKIVVRDKNSGRIGSVIHEFDVPQLGPLRVSTPVISDTLQRTPDGSEGPPRPAMLTRRNFAAGAMVYVQFEVYGMAKDKTTNLPKVTAGYQIRRSDGAIERRVEPSTITPTSIGRVSRMVGTRLEGTEPGEYELVLTVRDEVAGKSVEIREPFTVEPAPAAG